MINGFGVKERLKKVSLFEEMPLSHLSIYIDMNIARELKGSYDSRFSTSPKQAMGYKC